MAKRKKLLSLKGMDVRPMMEVVKGAAFGILQAAGGCPASLRPAKWLDFYSGTGSVGIEAISRGCSEAHFVEMDPWVVSNVLQPNLEHTGFVDASVIHTAPVENFLERADKTVVEYPSRTTMLDSCGCLEKMTDRREPQALDIGAHEILPDADIALAAGLDELAQMLDLQSGKPSTVAGIRFMAFLEEDEMAFDNLYCIAFQMMDAQWLAKRASYMEFNVKIVLHIEPTSFLVMNNIFVSVMC